MNPNEDYQWCLQFLKRIFRQIGQDILAENYRRSIAMYSMSIWWILIAMCLMFTFADTEHYDASVRYAAASFCSGVVQVRNTMVDLFSSPLNMSISMTPIQIAIKYIWMHKLRVLLPNLEFFADIYRKNSDPRSKYYAICSSFAKRSRKIMLYGYIAYSSLFVVFFFVGAYDMWRTNMKLQLTNIYVPGISEYSTTGSLLLLIPNFVMIVLGSVCVSPQDLLFFLIFSNVPLVTAIMRGQMNELTLLLRSPSGDVALVKQHFLHYIGVHHKYNE